MKVRFTDPAQQDLVGIYDYIAADSPRYARRTVDRITSRAKQIRTHPSSGGMVPELERPDIREVIEGPYRIIYRFLSRGLTCWRLCTERVFCREQGLSNQASWCYDHLLPYPRRRTSPLRDLRRDGGDGAVAATGRFGLSTMWSAAIVVCDQLGVDKEKITPETSFVNDLGVDSLDTVELVMELEEEFDINIPDDEAEKIQTVADAIRAILRRRGHFGGGDWQR